MTNRERNKVAKALQLVLDAREIIKQLEDDLGNLPKGLYELYDRLNDLERDIENAIER